MFEKNIKKLVIKSSSGYCPIEMAYKVELMIEDNKISYFYKLAILSEKQIIKKWSHINNTIEFKELFQKISSKISAIIYNSMEEVYLDIGLIEFEVTSDNN